MVEGPMNIEPEPLYEQETAVVAEALAAKPETVVPNEVPAGGAGVQFPTHQPRLTSGGSNTLNALKGNRG